MRYGRLVLLMLACLPSFSWAERSGEDGIAWLQKIASAARQVNYTGTFVYRHGNDLETSRIVHLSDESGEHEKLEMLDGAQREIIRNNDEVVCFMPENKTVIVEKRKLRKSFPAFLPLQLSGISENYVVRLAGMERVAELDCQSIILEPRDGYRYGHRLCAENSSGLLLKSITLNEKNEIVDQFFFTHASIGGVIDRGQLKPKFAMRHPVIAPVREYKADPGWGVRALPAGFKKIVESKRAFPGKKFPANHLVFSDHLAAVSVFIEPQAGVVKPLSGLSRQGAIHVYARPVDEYQVTVLGEVPAVTVMQIANSIFFSAK